MQNKENGKLLSVSTIYKEFGIKPALVYHWIRYRKFPVIKIDKKVLIPRADFEAFLNSHFIPGGES
jgi:hypothetical protein